MKGGVKMDNKEIKLDESKIDLTKEVIMDMPVVKALSAMSNKELKTICDNKGIIYKKTDGAKVLIPLIEKANSGVISLDNKPVSPIIVNNADEHIPANFINLPKAEKTEEMRSYKGRFYKLLANGYGQWTDNGNAFNLNEIR